MHFSSIAIALIIAAVSVLSEASHRAGQNRRAKLCKADSKDLAVRAKLDLLLKPIEPKFTEKDPLFKDIKEWVGKEDEDRKAAARIYSEVLKRTAKFLEKDIENSTLDLAKIPVFRDSNDLFAKAENFRPGQVFRAYKSADEKIVYLKFKSDLLQYLAFERIYLFVESKHKGRVFNDTEFEDYVLASNAALNDSGGGHDYRMADLAKFFSEAKAKGIRLGPIERQILRELLASKLIEINGKGFKATGATAVVSGAVDSPLSTIRHEVNHGVYFTNPKYREAATNLWHSLLPAEQKIVRRALEELDCYDFSTDNDLLVREFASYFQNTENLKDWYLEASGFNADLFPIIDIVGEKIRSIEPTAARPRDQGRVEDRAALRPTSEAVR